MKTSGNADVVRWIARNDQSVMYLSVVTLMELRRGIEIMPIGRRRQTLDHWLSKELPIRFGERILHVDEGAADI